MRIMNSYFRWKIKWGLELLGALRTMGNTCPLRFSAAIVYNIKAKLLERACLNSFPQVLIVSSQSVSIPWLELIMTERIMIRQIRIILFAHIE